MVDKTIVFKEKICIVHLYKHGGEQGGERMSIIFVNENY